MAFVRRHLSFRFVLGTGAFGEGGGDTVTLEGLRASVSIVKAGGVSQARADCRIWGMPLDVMNRLTILGKPLVDGRNNKLFVSAGDDNGGMATVYAGTISEAWVDPKGAPDVSLVCSAFSGLLAALAPIQPTSYKGTVDAARVVNGLAQQYGYAFENSGVTVQISNPYLHGTLVTQLQDIARAGGFNAVIEEDNASTGPTIAIWPAGVPRGALIPQLSASTGMIGYPMRTDNGIQVQTLFNPNITFGGQVNVQSLLAPANGTWTVARIAHDLEAEMPNGKWFTTLECNLFGQETAIING